MSAHEIGLRTRVLSLGARLELEPHDATLAYRLPPHDVSVVRAEPALALALLSACGGGTAATAPTATRSATATATPEPGTFYFTTDDKVTLSGKIVGTGTTAIVFSSMDGDPKIDWQDLAPLLASRGYMTFSYDYRGLGASQGYYDRSKIASDLNAAIQAAQQHGATKYVLMGASLGGLVTLKVAAAAHPRQSSRSRLRKVLAAWT